MDKDAFKHVEIFDLEFPEDCIGLCIKDVNVEILALDVLRIIDVFGRNGGLTEKQKEILQQLQGEFEVIWEEIIEGYEFIYFKKLQKEAQRVLTQVLGL